MPKRSLLLQGGLTAMLLTGFTVACTSTTLVLTCRCILVTIVTTLYIILTPFVIDFSLPTPGTARIPAQLGPRELESLIAHSEEEQAPMKRGVEKSIRWHGGQKASTEYVVVSIHGWSASCRELQPLDEMLADHLRANLYRHRLTGHGLLPMERSGEAMRDMTAEDLFRDVVDSFNCGTILGEKIILLASSTGAALSTWLCSRRWARGRIAACIFNSPAYALYPRRTYWIMKYILRNLHPVVGGALMDAVAKRPFAPRGTFGFQPHNEDNRYFWTSRYPTRALLNLFETLWHVEHRSAPGGLPACIDVPLLVFGNWKDNVVDLRRTLKVLEKMGYQHYENVESVEQPMQSKDEPYVERSDHHGDGAAQRKARSIPFTGKQLLYTFSNSNHPHCIVTDVFNPHLMSEALSVAGSFLSAHGIS